LLNCDWVYLLSIKRMPSKSDRWSAYLNHSQLAPSAKPAGYLHRRDCPAWPRGTSSRTNRAASGPYWDMDGWAISIQPHAPG
jgi:hypothetical protein